MVVTFRLLAWHWQNQNIKPRVFFKCAKSTRGFGSESNGTAYIWDSGTEPNDQPTNQPTD